MGFDIRPIDDDEVRLFRTKLTRGFGGDVSEKEGDKGDERFRATVPLERTRAAFDGNDLIGTLGCLPYGLAVPGGSLPMAGTTMITVQQTHRRRGALRAMMADHFADVRSAREPLAGLWASESSIYGRFGFGVATERHEMEFDAGAVDLLGLGDSGQVRLVEPDEAATVLPPIYDKLAASRPGLLSRSDPYWKWRILYDPDEWREGSSARRYLVYRGADGDEGYVSYRQKEKWEGFLASGEVRVVEMVATTPAAHDGLWRYLADIDLFPRVKYWNQPIDDELAWRVDDPRRVVRKVWDAMWVRVLDVPTALAGRSYAIDGSIRIGLSDDVLPDNAGTYEITSAAGESTCIRVDAEPDLRMNADALGAIYLGGQRLGPLARAGRLRGTGEAIRKADGFFAWDPAPWCAEVF
jgi:predicted acetyltransferase